MKTNLIFALLVASLFTTAGSAQQTTAANTVAGVTPRVSFVLKNTLGYHRMFRVEGPGIAYGFTMNRRETVPCNWPVGAKLYFSQDGEANGKHILTVAATDEGQTLTTGTGIDEAKPAVQMQPVSQEILVRFRNNSLKFRKVAMITYQPNETGNGTNIFTMAPFGVTSKRFPVGTLVYLADDRQVEVVMSGKRIDGSKPFLTIKKEDAGKSFDVN